MTRFHLFGRLPIELRLKIWNLSLDQDRIIYIEEIVKKGWFSLNEPNIDNCHTYRVALHSRIPPAILHVSKETRQMFIPQYKHVLLGNTTETSKDCRTYFNPERDILFFRCSCLSILNEVFKTAYTGNFCIPRVALTMTTDVNCWQLHGGENIEQVMGLPRVLHGISDDLGIETSVPGCPGLKHVFFVQSTIFSPRDIDVKFRPAVDDPCLCHGESSYKQRRVRMIKQLETDIKSSGSNQENKYKNWVADNKPSFSIVGLAPKTDADSWVYVTLILDPTSAVNLARHKHERAGIDAASKYYKCTIIWGKYVSWGRERRPALGLSGPAEGVQKMKKMIRARTASKRSIVL
jgi:hypothetical protein